DAVPQRTTRQVVIPRLEDEHDIAYFERLIERDLERRVRAACCVQHHAQHDCRDLRIHTALDQHGVLARIRIALPTVAHDASVGRIERAYDAGAAKCAHTQ